MAEKKKIELRLTSAVAIGGEIVLPGSGKSKADCTVSETLAKNLLHRGKAELFGDQDLEGTGIVDPADTDSGAKNGFPPPAKDGQNRSGSPLVQPQGGAELGSNATPGAGSGAAPAKPAAKGESAGGAK
jgi:hypothetical protein